MSNAITNLELGETYVGRTSFMFFALSLRGANGGTAPDALPKETIVPFRLIMSKSFSNLYHRLHQSSIDE